MKLMTKEIAQELFLADKSFIETGETPQKVIVKYFNPCGAQTWLIVQGTPLDGRNGASMEDPDNAQDWHLFGLCDLGLGFPELGYVLLSELESVRGPLGLGIERDLHYEGTLKQVQGGEELDAHEEEASQLVSDFSVECTAWLEEQDLGAKLRAGAKAGIF